MSVDLGFPGVGMTVVRTKTDRFYAGYGDVQAGTRIQVPTGNVIALVAAGHVDTVPLRDVFPKAVPEAIASLNGSDVEIMSFPVPNGEGAPTVMVRTTVGDPTTIREVALADLTF